MAGAPGLRLSRRTLLQATAGGAFTATAGWGLRSSASAARPPRGPFRSALPIPRVLDGADLRLPIREAEIQILPGAPTRMWTYGGDFPGPTIRRPSGERTTVRFDHRLPPKAGELTVHLHGSHSRSADDGQPGGLTPIQPRSLYCQIARAESPEASGSDLLIRPGGSRTYTYDFVAEGAPTRAAMHWYHDHRLDNTGRNNWRGLAGMWITDDALDVSLPLPTGDRDIPLMLSDRSFDQHNQLTNPFRYAGHAPNDGNVGRRILVNGAVLPHHPVEGRRYRLRVLNASLFRAYNLAFSRPVPVLQIGTESGLLPAPIARNALVIGPGERVDVVVDFSAVAGKDIELVSVPRTGGPKKLGSTTYVGPLMQFRVGRAVSDPASVPAVLRPLPDWVATAPAEPSHAWEITVGGGFRPAWLINGRTFDPGFVDHRVQLGTVATWRLRNRTSVAHLLHLHHTEFHMLSRNGRPPAPWEAGLKETFFLDPGDDVLVAGRFSDYAGKYVVHCHMLDHEDHGLMAQFQTYA
ncbi:MAG: hypothetical protein QOF76_1536 [Solirubrobacteraceae bacterium]|nr:hypothetical protein [Solirubrobacteraceae bacterium]